MTLRTQIQSNAENHECFLICGASSGLGKAVALELSNTGAELILVARNLDNLNSVAGECKLMGSRRTQIVSLDFTDENEIKNFKTTFLSSHPKKFLDGFVLNGGGAPSDSGPTSISISEMDNAHQLLLKGPIFFSQCLLPYLKERSSIVALTSTTTRESNPVLTLSGMYRSALVAWLKSLSVTLGDRGIRVNSIAPGYVGTEKLEELKSSLALTTYGKDSQETRNLIKKDWESLSALKKIAEPSEIAKVVKFLLSKDSSFVTGQQLIADGGQVRGY